MISAALRQNHLPQDKKIYNITDSKVNEASFTQVYAAFQVLPPCFESLLTIEGIPNAGFVREIFDILLLLHRTVMLLYLWPNDKLEGDKCMEYVFGRSNGRYFKILQKRVDEFSEHASKLFASKNPCAELLDKPNLHRLRELVIHTLPKFGHVRHISDLTYEHKHQALKKGYQRGNNTENNNFALRTDVYQNWKQTLGRTYTKLSRNDLFQDERKEYTAFLLSLLLGVRRNPPLQFCDQSFLRDATEVAFELLTPSLRSDLKRAGYLAPDREPTESSPWLFPRDNMRYDAFIKQELKDMEERKKKKKKGESGAGGDSGSGDDIQESNVRKMGGRGAGDDSDSGDDIQESNVRKMGVSGAGDDSDSGDDIQESNVRNMDWSGAEDDSDARDDDSEEKMAYLFGALRKEFSEQEMGSVRFSNNIPPKQGTTARLIRGVLFSQPLKSPSGELHKLPEDDVYSFYSVVGTREKGAYVLARPCEQVNHPKARRGYDPRTFSVPPLYSQDTLHILPLTTETRRLASYHLCDSSCRMDGDANVLHSETIIQGGKFVVHGRMSGYPPRCG